MDSLFSILSETYDDLPSSSISPAPPSPNRTERGTDENGKEVMRRKQVLGVGFEDMLERQKRKKENLVGNAETKQANIKEAGGQCYEGSTSTTSSTNKYRNKQAASISVYLAPKQQQDAALNKTKKGKAEETDVIDLCSSSDEEKLPKQIAARSRAPTLRKTESSLKRGSSFSTPSLKKLKSDLSNSFGSENDSFSTAPEEPFDNLSKPGDVVQSIEISPSPILGPEVLETSTQRRLPLPSQGIATVDLRSESPSSETSVVHSEGKAQPLPLYLAIKPEEENSQSDAESISSEISFPARTSQSTQESSFQPPKSDLASSDALIKKEQPTNTKDTISLHALEICQEPVIKAATKKPLPKHLARPNRSWIERHPTRLKSPSDHVATRDRYPLMPKRPVAKRPLRRPKVYGARKVKESRDIYTDIEDSDKTRSWNEKRMSKTKDSRWTTRSEFANESLSIGDALELQVKDEECDAAFSSHIEDALPGSCSMGVFAIPANLMESEATPTEICMLAEFRMAPYNEKPTFQ